jgi:hypothetical protein
MVSEIMSITYGTVTQLELRCDTRPTNGGVAVSDGIIANCTG